MRLGIGLKGPEARRLAILTVLVMGIAGTLLTLLVGFGIAMPRPFMRYEGPAYSIDYYNISTITAPTLIIRTYINGLPVDFTVSLFALSPRHVFTVGYYEGYGTVSITLTTPTILDVANRWVKSGIPGYTSLVVIITYVEGDEVRPIILTIPYNPRWIAQRKPILIMAITKLDLIKPIIVKPINKIGMAQTTNNQTSNKDTYGYAYEGSCVGNSNAVPPQPAYPGDGVWKLVNCELFYGPYPLFFVGWSTGGLADLNYIQIGPISGSIEKGAGFYGMFDVSGISGQPSELELSNGPSYSFSSNYIVYPVSGIVYVYHDPFISEDTLEIVNDVYNYYVNGPGYVYIGFPAYIGYLSFEFYQYLGGKWVALGIWANGTEILSLPSSDFGGAFFHIYPYLDVGNGSITALFTGTSIYEGLTNELSFTLLDGVSYVDRSVTNACNNAPLYGAGEFGSNDYFVNYPLEELAMTYHQNLLGFASEAGDDFVALAPLLSIPANQLGPSSNTFIIIYVNLHYDPYSYAPFYVTLVGTYPVTTYIGTQSAYLVGMIINATNYYTGQVYCQS